MTGPGEAAGSGDLLDGRYRLESVVARGGMAEIWRASDQESGEAVAVKRLVVDPDDPFAEEDRTRLLHEIQALQGLDHPNIVRCLGWGEDAAQRPFLVQQWLEGEDLAARQARQPLTLDEVREVMVQALDGLAAAHAQGLVHRDIKPGNLFLGRDGQVRLLDFGVARVEHRLTRVTRPGLIVGTLYYLSPEQVQGDAPVDHRADIYAMGVVLYELTTGRLPFAAEEPVAVMLKIVSESPPLPRLLRPDLPDWLEDVILRAMMRWPAERFATAEQMRAALSAGRRTEQVVRPASAAEAPDPTDSTPATIEQRQVCLLGVEPWITPGDDDDDDMLAGDDTLASDEVRRAVEGRGGVYHGLLGGSAVGVFGLDRTTGGEASRAVQAGLDLLASASEPGPRLMVSTVRLEVGHGLRLDTGALDRLSRTLGRLPGGELVLDAATSHLLGERVVLARRGDHQVVVGLPASDTGRRRVLGVETPLLGRDGELAVIRATLDRASGNGEPEAVLVVGPAGMGKSRLLAEVRPALQEAASLCLVGQAEPSRRLTPHSLLADALLRQADAQPASFLQTLVERLGLDPAASGEVVAFLAEAMGLPGEPTEAVRVARDDPRLMRQQITGAFAALLAAAGRAGPVVICLDDLQWADEESLDLLEVLIERLEDTPLLLLCAGRPELLELRPALFQSIDGTRLRLEALGRRSLRRLLTSILGAAPVRELVELVLQRAGGNPYFAEELLSWMAARGHLDRNNGGWGLRSRPDASELPAGVEAAIQGRLDRLEVALKDVVKAAAVFGERFWEGGCAALGFAAAGQRLAALEKAEVVLPRRSTRLAGEREWAFCHGLVRQVAYGMLPAGRRRELHLAAGRWLESVGEVDPAQLAHHFQEGGDPESAAGHLARAGVRNLAEGNLQQAVASFEAALAGDVGAEGDRAERRLGLARALYRLGRSEEALPLLEQVERAPGAMNTRRLEVLVLRAKIHLGAGDAAEAENLLLETSTRLERSPDLELVFEVRHSLFWVLWVQGRYQDAGPVARDLLRLARSTGRQDQASSAKLARAYFHAVAGDLSRTLELAREAVDHARAARHPFREMDSLMLLGYSLQSAGLYEAALQTLQEALALAARIHSRHHLASIESCRGQIYCEQGAAVEASRCFKDARRMATELGDNRTLATVLAYEARLLASGEDPAGPAAALDLAGQALALVSGKMPPVEAEVHLALTRAQLSAGAPDRALEQGRRALELLDRLGDQEPYAVEILLAVQDALAAGGQQTEAAAQLARARRLLEQRAERITNERVRNSFLSAVPHNRRVMSMASSEPAAGG